MDTKPGDNEKHNNRRWPVKQITQAGFQPEKPTLWIGSEKDLLDQPEVEQDNDKRNELIKQALVIIRDDLPVLPLYDQMLAWAMRSNIDMFQPPNNTTPLRYTRMN